MRTLIGAWRLLRVTLHVFHGMVVAARELGGATEATRALHVQWWSAKLLRLLGIRLTVGGRFQLVPQLLVCNHVSWLDIIALHAVYPQARFVSKADVRAWPLLGWLIGAAGTLFIERESKRDALRVVHQMAEALKAGDTVAVFPEGTTSDGHALLPFHANLLQAAISTAVPVQPLLLRFSEPDHPVSARAAYIGDTTLVQSLWWIATARGLRAHVEILAMQPSTGHDRRSLGRQLEAAMTTGLQQLPRA